MGKAIVQTVEESFGGASEDIESEAMKESTGDWIASLKSATVDIDVRVAVEWTFTGDVTWVFVGTSLPNHLCCSRIGGNKMA